MFRVFLTTTYYLPLVSQRFKKEQKIKLDVLTFKSYTERQRPLLIVNPGCLSS